MCGTFAACYTVKKDQKGDTTMCKAMEDMRKEERMEAEYEAHLVTAKILVNHPDLRLDALEAGACKSSN